MCGLMVVWVTGGRAWVVWVKSTAMWRRWRSKSSRVGDWEEELVFGCEVVALEVKRRGEERWL